MGSNTNDPMGLCGRGSGCFVGIDGAHHNQTWHRLQDTEAENEALRESIQHILNNGYPDEAWDRAYDEAEKHGIPTKYPDPST